MSHNKLRPIHPGEILADELEELELSARAFASELHVPTNRITMIMNGERSITADTALRLAKFFGTTAELWLTLQITYDLKITEKTVGKKIEQQVHSYSQAAEGVRFSV